VEIPVRFESRMVAIVLENQHGLGMPDVLEHLIAEAARRGQLLPAQLGDLPEQLIKRLLVRRPQHHCHNSFCLLIATP
jgi:hypothetical protein